MTKNYDISVFPFGRKAPEKMFINSSDKFVFKAGTSVILAEGENAGKEIVTHNGTICDFPGIDYCEELKKELSSKKVQPIVEYEAIISPYNENSYLMLWTIRPDGRYWMDSWGFGAEDYESVCLYSIINSKGFFTAPFRLYRIGYREFAKLFKEGSD